MQVINPHVAAERQVEWRATAVHSAQENAGLQVLHEA